MIFDYLNQTTSKKRVYSVRLPITNSLEVVKMIKFNNEFIGLGELREKYHLVSKWQVSCLAHCRYSVIDKVCKENNIKTQSVNVNNRPCLFYDELIIDLLQKIRPVKNITVPENYIPKKELIKYLGITPKTLNDIEFWCWDFKKHKKSINGKIYYDFSESAKDFYNRKLYKWKYPDRTKCTYCQ